MPWYAFDAVDDALDATRNFLFPFTWGRWLRLAIIVFFLGGGGSGLNNLSNLPSALQNDGGTTPPPTGGEVPPLPELVGFAPTLVSVIGAVILFVVLLLVVVSSVMPFVFVDAIRTNDVRIRGPFKRRFGEGIRYLFFQIGVFLLLAIPVGIGVFALFLGSPDPTFPSSIGLAGILVLVALALVVAVVVGLLFGFTRQFVIPVMIATDSGVISSWRQFWPTLRGEWKQFVVYLFVRFVLQLGVGIAQFVVILVLGGVILVATVLVGLLVATSFGGFAAALETTAGLVAFGVLGVLALLAFLAISLPIGILVQSYFTTYELSVLGAANDRFALLPRRSDGGDGDDGDGTDFSDGNGGGGGDDTTEFVWGDDSNPA